MDSWRFEWAYENSGKLVQMEFDWGKGGRAWPSSGPALDHTTDHIYSTTINDNVVGSPPRGPQIE